VGVALPETIRRQWNEENSINLKNKESNIRQKPAFFASFFVATSLNFRKEEYSIYFFIMAGRNRLPAHALKGAQQAMPPMHEGPYARGAGPLPPHPALVEEMRNGPHGRGPGPLLPHPAVLQERLAAQNQEIQGMLVENQRLAATHVALRQELASANQELQHLSHVANSMQADKDHHLNELYEKSMKLEAEMRALEPMRAELMQLRADNQKMSSAGQELTTQAQSLTQELTRVWSDMQQAAALRTEMQSLHEEFEGARNAIEYERKARAARLEQGQTMEKNFISMSREVEKLRAELANVDKKERGAANTGGAYGGNYGSAEMGYNSGAYGGDGYGMHPVQGAEESGGQYGARPAAWGAYEAQRSHVQGAEESGGQYGARAAPWAAYETQRSHVRR
jgi:hypothetical protein